MVNSADTCRVYKQKYKTRVFELFKTDLPTSKTVKYNFRMHTSTKININLQVNTSLKSQLKPDD